MTEDFFKKIGENLAEDLLNKIVPFKRNTYEKVIREFKSQLDNS